MWKYLLFLIAIHTLGRLPVYAGYAAARVIGRLVYWFSPGSRRNVTKNLRHVMPEAPESVIRAAVLRVFQNVARYYIDLVHMPHMSLDDFYSDRLRYFGFDEHVLPAVAEGKGVIAISIHIGNPELGVQGMLPRGVKALALTEPLKPDRLSRLVDSLRSCKGHTFLPVSVKGVRAAMRTLRKGGVIALMGDRDIHGPKTVLPFFGVDTWMPTGPIELALRTGATVIPSFCIRTPEGGINAYLEEPMQIERSGDLERDIRTNALRFLARAEHYLREYPDQWIVLESIWDGAEAPAEPPR